MGQASVAQQITEAFPWNGAPRYLIRDRDGLYGPVVRRRLRAMGVRAAPSGTPVPGLLADKPLEGCDPRFVFLDQVGGSSIVVEGAFLVSADPDTDQVKAPADNQIGRYW